MQVHVCAGECVLGVSARSVCRYVQVSVLGVCAGMCARNVT